MSIKNRLRKLETNLAQPQKIMFVRYPAELVEIYFGGEKFERYEWEGEDEFIQRIKNIVQKRAGKRGLSILIGNF